MIECFEIYKGWAREYDHDGPEYLELNLCLLEDIFTIQAEDVLQKDKAVISGLFHCGILVGYGAFWKEPSLSTIYFPYRCISSGHRMATRLFIKRTLELAGPEYDFINDGDAMWSQGLYRFKATAFGDFDLLHYVSCVKVPDRMEYGVDWKKT